MQAKFASGLFDGVLPDPANATVLDSPPHRELAFRAAAEGAVLLLNRANRTARDGGGGGSGAALLPLPLAPADLEAGGKAAPTRVAIIGPNSGCGEQAPAPPPAPPGQCTHTQGVDCPGADVLKVNNVSGAEACCALCVAHKECIAAVLAVGATAPAPGGQCMIKSSCDAPTTMPDRVLLRTGRTPPGPAQPGQALRPAQTRGKPTREGKRASISLFSLAPPHARVMTGASCVTCGSATANANTIGLAAAQPDNWNLGVPCNVSTL